MTECAAFQDKSSFPLQIPINSQKDCIYFKWQKKNVPDKFFSHESNRLCVKVISAALTKHGVTKPLSTLKIIVNS